MSFTDKILNKSNSYQFYKENYQELKDENMQLKAENEELKSSNEEIKVLKDEIKTLNKKISRHNKVLNSHNMLLDVIYIQSNFRAGGHLRKIQLHSIELLKFVANVCEENNLKYWLDYGTLLGSLRHGGFVPWDDEVDISMPREDYEKFVVVMAEKLSQIPEVDEKITLSIGVSQFRGMKNDAAPTLSLQFMHETPHANVDVHPIDYYDIDPKENPDIIEEIHKDFIKTKRSIVGKVERGEYGSYNEAAIVEGNKFHITFEETEYMGSSMDGTGRRPVHVSDIYPLKRATFEGIEFSIPNNPIVYLNAHYRGDLFKLPQIVRDHDFSGKIRNDEYGEMGDMTTQMILDEMDEIYEETISFWKRINSE